jgi:hypothetical protein
VTGVEVIAGAVKVKLEAVCAGDGFKLAAAVVVELKRKLNVGFVAGTVLLRSRLAPNPVPGGLLTDELALMNG